MKIVQEFEHEASCHRCLTKLNMGLDDIKVDFDSDEECYHYHFICMVCGVWNNIEPSSFPGEIQSYLQER